MLELRRSRKMELHRNRKTELVLHMVLHKGLELHMELAHRNRSLGLARSSSSCSSSCS